MNEKSKKYLEEIIKRRKESLESAQKAHSENKQMWKIVNNRQIPFTEQDFIDYIENTEKEIEYLISLKNMDNNSLKEEYGKNNNSTLKIICILENILSFRIYEDAICITALSRDYLDLIEYVSKNIKPHFTHIGIMSVRGAGYNDLFVKIDNKKYIVKQKGDNGIERIFETKVSKRSYDAGMYSKRYFETI